MTRNNRRISNGVRLILPQKEDPRWFEIIRNIKDYNFIHLPTKMLMMRIYLISQDGTPQKIQEAIESAYDFFYKNSNTVAEDINVLFGNEKPHG